MFYDPYFYRSLHIGALRVNSQEQNTVFQISIQRVKSQGNDKMLSIKFKPSITTTKKIKFFLISC